MRRPFLPRQGCLSNDGPGLSHLIASATSPINGQTRISKLQATRTSEARFIAFSNVLCLFILSYYLTRTYLDTSRRSSLSYVRQRSPILSIKFILYSGDNFVASAPRRSAVHRQVIEGEKESTGCCG